MSMKLLDRVATLLRADAHGVVESLEDRALLLKQYVREAELDLNRKRARLEALREEGKRLAEALAGCEAEVRSLDEDIELALKGDKEELARFSIRRLLPRRTEVGALRSQLEQRAAEERCLAEQLATQQAQLERLRTRVRAEVAQTPATESVRPAWLSETAVSDEEVEIELMRRRQAPGGES